MNDRLIQQAAEQAMKMGPTIQQPVQVIINAADLVRMTEVGIITKEQAFEAMFKGKLPTEYLGEKG